MANETNDFDCADHPGADLPAPAIAAPNAELWRQWESQIDSADARVAALGVKMSRQSFFLASQSRRGRFRSCMETNRKADFVEAVLACQLEQEVEFGSPHRRPAPNPAGIYPTRGMQQLE